MAMGSPPISRAALTADLVEKGIRKVFFEEYMRRVGESDWMYNISTSEKQFENDVQFAGLATFSQKAEGQVPDFDTMRHAWKKTYEHLTWAQGVKVTEEAREDDLYGVLAKMGTHLGNAAAYTQEVEAIKLLNDLSATAYTAGGSDFTLLSTAHFRQDDGTWSNQLAGNGDLDIVTLEALLIQAHTGTLDQRGRLLNIKPKFLVVAPEDKFIARRILNSIQRPFTANNDINPIREEDLELKVMSHLTGDGRWFLAADKSDRATFRFNRRPLRMKQETEGTGSGNMVMVGSYRRSEGVSNVYGWWGSS